MELLLLGGTAFLGRAIAHAALAAGHEVTCVARGSSGEVPDGARLVSLDRDTDDALAPLTGRRWDAVIDLACQPGHVRRAVRDLTADHWVFVSTGNVYADTSTRGLTEEADLLPPLDGDVMESMERYGEAKVACEALIRTTPSWLIARAGLIGGPGDVSGRSGYWPWRFTHPSGPRVLVPDVADAPSQIIDVRDLADWLVRVAAERTTGVVNAVGADHTVGEMLETASRVAGSHTPTTPMSAARLVEEGVAEWAGPRSLPLWISDPDWQGFSARDGSRAERLGLHRRPIEETFRDTLAWEEQQPLHPHGAGLSDDEERALLGAQRLR